MTKGTTFSCEKLLTLETAMIEYFLPDADAHDRYFRLTMDSRVSPGWALSFATLAPDLAIRPISEALAWAIPVQGWARTVDER